MTSAIITDIAHALPGTGTLRVTRAVYDAMWRTHRLDYIEAPPLEQPNTFHPTKYIPLYLGRRVEVVDGH